MFYLSACEIKKKKKKNLEWNESGEKKELIDHVIVW